MPHGGYNPYNQPYNPAAEAYNNDQGEEEEEEDEEPDPYYYRGYPPQYYPRHPQAPHGYQTEDVEMRSPGVARRFPRHAGARGGNDMEEREGGT